MGGQHLGFVGVGRMGGPMAGRLLGARHEMTIVDNSESALKPLLERGAHRAGTPKDVASEALAMGVTAGVDPKIMDDIINVSSGRNSATQDKFPRLVPPGTFDFGFATGLSYKDVR